MRASTDVDMLQNRRPADNSVGNFTNFQLIRTVLVIVLYPDHNEKDQWVVVKNTAVSIVQNAFRIIAKMPGYTVSPFWCRCDYVHEKNTIMNERREAMRKHNDMRQ